MMWKPHQSRQPAPSDKTAKENDMHTKILLPLAALLLGAALPAQDEPTCSEYDPPEYRSRWNVHSHHICRYPHTTLNAAYVDWRNWMVQVDGPKALLPKLPARSRTVKPTDIEYEYGLREIVYTLAPDQVTVLISEKDGESVYRFRLRDGYVEMHGTNSTSVEIY